MATVLAVLALLAVRIPGAQGAFLAKVSNSTNAAGTNRWFTCVNADSDTSVPNPLFAYPFAETSGTVASDVSGRGNSGTYTATGITYGEKSSVCPRDRMSALTLDGSSGYVSGPSALLGAVGSNVFTEEIWFKTTTTSGGKLIGFGSSRTGSSVSYDRHLYMTNDGRIVFGVYPNAVKTVTSPKSYNDGQWHFAAATLSLAGMVLYLDGVAVASDTTVTTAQVFTGFWRIGYDNLTTWTNMPKSFFFMGSIAFAAVWDTTALSSTVIGQQYAAGT